MAIENGSLIGGGGDHVTVHATRDIVTVFDITTSSLAHLHPPFPRGAPPAPQNPIFGPSQMERAVNERARRRERQVID